MQHLSSWRLPQSCSVVVIIEWPLDQRFFFCVPRKEMDGRTCVCCCRHVGRVLSMGGGWSCYREKKTRHFYLIFVFVSYSYFGVGEAEEIRKRFLFIFSFVWPFHRLQQTHINPSRSNPLFLYVPRSFSVYVTCNAAGWGWAAVCVYSLSGYFHGGSMRPGWLFFRWRREDIWWLSWAPERESERVTYDGDKRLSFFLFIPWE